MLRPCLGHTTCTSVLIMGSTGPTKWSSLLSSAWMLPMVRKPGICPSKYNVFDHKVVFFHFMSLVFTIFYFGHSASRASRYDKGHIFIFLSLLVCQLEVLCCSYLCFNI